MTPRLKSGLPILLAVAALGWLVAVAMGQRHHWAIQAEFGGRGWLAWFHGKQVSGTHTDLVTTDGQVAWAVQHMQRQLDRPLDLLWLRTPQSPYLPSFDWGCIAAAMHPGRLRVHDPHLHMHEVDGVILPSYHVDEWQRQPGMELLDQRFPHFIEIRNLARIAVTDEMAWLLKGLEPQEFWPTTLGKPDNAASISERRVERWLALGWTIAFLMMLTLQGGLLLVACGVTGWSGRQNGDSPLNVAEMFPLALGIGAVIEVAVLWALGLAGIPVGVWCWRMLHMVPLATAAFMVWRRAGKGAAGFGFGTPKAWRVIPAALIGVLALMLLSGPAPLRDAPGRIRDGYKAERFFEQGMMSVEVVVPTAESLRERGFSRPGYPPAWAGLTFAMALWCGGFDAAPFLMLPMVMLAAALMLLAGTGTRWLAGTAFDRKAYRATAGMLWFSLAASVPVLGYCGSFHAEPWMLLLLAGTWALMLGNPEFNPPDRTGTIRMPWRRVLLAGLLLGAACSVKREGMLWAALGLAALPFLPGMDWRRWLALGAMVAAMAVPALAWRTAVGAGLEDFSLSSFHEWRKQGLVAERLGQTWAEVSRWLWRRERPQDAFALVVPIGLTLWGLGMGWSLIRAKKDAGRRLALAMPLLTVVVGGIAAVVGMFFFSHRSDLGHHLTAVWRLLLPIATAAWLLGVQAMAGLKCARTINWQCVL